MKVDFKLCECKNRFLQMRSVFTSVLVCAAKTWLTDWGFLCNLINFIINKGQTNVKHPVLSVTKILLPFRLQVAQKVVWWTSFPMHF